MNVADEFYDKIKNQFLVPSLFIIIIQCSAIFFAFEYFMNLNANAWIIGLVLLGFAFLMFFPIYKNSIKSKNHSDNIKKSTLLILISIIIASISLFQIKINSTSFITDISNKNHRAIVTKIIKKRYNTEVIIKIYNKDGEKINAIAYIYDDFKFHKNDEIIIQSNPVKTNGNNYKFYLNNKNFKIIKKSKPSELFFIKNCIIKKIKSLFQPGTARLIQALVTGNKSCISKNVIQYYKKAGALHVLAASGLHVGIIALVPFFILSPIRANKKVILIITLKAIYLYIMLTDMPISLVRSIIMFSIFTFLHILHKEKNIFNALFLSAVIILLLFPFQIKNPGFHLSFGATLGILLFFNIYKKHLQFIPGFLSNPISLSFSALVIVYPIIYFHMKEINLISVISNIIIVPMTGLILVLGIIAIIISFIIQIPASYIGQTVNYIYDVNLWIVKLFSFFKGHFYLEDLNLIIVLCYIIFLFPVIPFNKLIYYQKKMCNFFLNKNNNKKPNRTFKLSVKLRLNKNKSIKIFLCSFIPILICWILLNSNEVNNKLYIIKNNKSKVLLFKNTNSASIIGELAAYDQCIKVINLIKKTSIDRIQLYIIKPDYKNIKFFSYLARKVNIENCYINSKWIPSRYMENFFKILNQDNVDPKFININIANNSKIGGLSKKTREILRIYLMDNKHQPGVL